MPAKEGAIMDDGDGLRMEAAGARSLPMGTREEASSPGRHHPGNGGRDRLGTGGRLQIGMVGDIERNPH